MGLDCAVLFYLPIQDIDGSVYETNSLKDRILNLPRGVTAWGANAR